MAHKSRRNHPRKDITKFVIAGVALLGAFLFESGIPVLGVVLILLTGLGVLALAGWLVFKQLKPKTSVKFEREPVRQRPFQRGEQKTANIQFSALEQPLTEVRPASTAYTEPYTLSEQTLRRLDWLAFEYMVVDLFTHLDFRAKKTGSGADGGVDIELHSKQASPGALPSVLIQCKARANAMIGVDKVRELYGVMAARGIRSGILICNTIFSADAYAFSKANPSLRLGDLSWVMTQVSKVPHEVRSNWERKYFGTDYDVPSCPACETKLVRRTGKKGQFWGCSNFPRGCRTRLPMRAEAMDR